MEFLLATPIDDFAQLKATCASMDTYNLSAKWLVVASEETAGMRAYLKAWSIKRQKPAYFLSAAQAKSLNSVAFSGPSARLNAALLCAAVTETPLLLIQPPAQLISKELAQATYSEADAVVPQCCGFSESPSAWQQQIQTALTAQKAGIIAPRTCKEQIDKALEGQIDIEAAPCCEALWIQSKAAQTVCFSPQTADAFLFWVFVAERLGLTVEQSQRPWVKHPAQVKDQAGFARAWQNQTRLEFLTAAAEYVFEKTAARTLSDYLVDEAAEHAVQNTTSQPALSVETAAKIRALKEPLLTKRADNLTQAPDGPSQKQLAAELRGFMTAWKTWRQTIQACKETDAIHFYE